MNEGDIVTATVNFNEAVNVVTTGGSPTLGLKIGTSTVQATFAGNASPSALRFTYTITANQTDTDGISIDANSLTLGGATIRNAAGIDLSPTTHGALGNQADFKVDTTAPTALPCRA